VGRRTASAPRVSGTGLPTKCTPRIMPPEGREGNEQGGKHHEQRLTYFLYYLVCFWGPPLLTQRCHGRDFLLKFARDRRQWTTWLFEARKLYGYREIQEPPRRYRRIDLETLARLLELSTVDELRTWQRRSVRECLQAKAGRERRPEWTESIAVGDESFLESIKTRLGMAARHRTIQSLGGDASMLCEAPQAYSAGNKGGMPNLNTSNALPWKLSP